MRVRLRNRAAIVTGAAQGFGLGIAQTFIREGAQVAMLDADHTHDTLDATAHFVHEQHLLVDRALLPPAARR